MTATSDAPAFSYVVAWIVQVAVVAFYMVAAAFLRWRPRRTVEVARYEPPPGISPAVAAYLLEGGRCERAIAAAIVSLAAKGYLEIRQQGDFFVLEKRREPEAKLPPEESLVLKTLFAGVLTTCSFNAADFASVRLA